MHSNQPLEELLIESRLTTVYQELHKQRSKTIIPDSRFKDSLRRNPEDLLIIFI